MELEHAKLFHELSPEVLSRIRRLARVQDYVPEETIFSEGDPAQDLYILREGSVELSYTLPQDATTEIRITRVAPGETFAWSALARGGTMTAHALSLSEASAFIIPGDRLHGLFIEHPEAGYEVMSRLAQQILARLRETRRELRWLHQSAR